MISFICPRDSPVNSVEVDTSNSDRSCNVCVLNVENNVVICVVSCVVNCVVCNVVLSVVVCVVDNVVFEVVVCFVFIVVICVVVLVVVCLRSVFCKLVCSSSKELYKNTHNFLRRVILWYGLDSQLVQI